MLASTAVHPGLLTSWEFAQKVRGDLLQNIHPLTTAEWAYRPAAGAWCIAEVADHLLRAEIGTSKMVRKLIRGDYRAEVVPVGVTLHTKELGQYPYGRLEAPAVLVPGPVRDKADVERELGLAHARLRSELSLFQGDDPEALRSPDPATGVWFTLGGWVKLQAWHEAHHLDQIRAVMTAPNFPR